MASRWADRPNETRVSTDPNESSSSPEENRSHASESVNYEVIGPRQYSYDQLAKATHYFSNNYLLGEGGFGQVYKAFLDGKIRAVKKLKILPSSKENLGNEIKVAGKVSHKNLVKLGGYGIDGADRLLVFKYFPSKSLRSKLHGESFLLPWIYSFVFFFFFFFVKR
ncbi:proline-rich receptor-like protein kinase PERK15 isoform X1 [Hevea brasiliensis]|uniref:proline-rich receptor-like protein kinase PERK15 isoform X1 n=1 Tax=Hevea brasiliensis TaxID=3981 RepID=UPI0025E51912|nr:proline-rich receptor-like protein kinase PERK15 isoform X1 [Hevea brasiliensis]